MQLPEKGSLSIPAVFSPIIEEDGNLLIDGGVTNNLPVDVLLLAFMLGGSQHQVEIEKSADFCIKRPLPGYRVI
jgi:hypothetical protein